MSKFKLWLWMKWAALSARVNKYFENTYRTYMSAKALKEAEEFLKKFREGRGYLSYPPVSNSHCKHLKGGKLRGFCKDYNVACHTFPDGSKKIWCLNGCGFQIWSDRDNKDNRSKAWRGAIAMLEQSTNTPSSSERFADFKGYK